MKISFDRKEYLSVSSVFENESLDDVDSELSEFNEDATDMAYELAYTRYALAKAEAGHTALVDAVKKERAAQSRLSKCGCNQHRRECQVARAEVDRLIGGE